MTPDEKIKMLEEELKFEVRLTAVIAHHHQSHKETITVLRQKLKEEKEKLEKKHE